MKGWKMSAFALAAGGALIGTSAQAATWPIEQGGVSYAVEQKPTGVAMLIDNGSAADASVSPEDVMLYAGSNRIPVCTIFQTSMFGLGAPGVQVTVKPGERNGFILGGCGPDGMTSTPASPLKVDGPITRIKVDGLSLRQGNPKIPHAHPQRYPNHPPT